MDEPELFDFDHGTDWLRPLRASLDDLLPPNVDAHLRHAEPDGLWSAKTALAEVVELGTLYARVRDWVSRRDVVGYHGTRLDLEQRASVESNGLLPLVPAQREEAIRRLLSAHSRWPEVSHRLPEVVSLIGNGGAGNRTGQVHLTLSGAGMLRSFNHYLVEGAEFDHHVVYHLLGEECHELNRARGLGVLYRIRLDGATAIAAANPFGEIREPNLLNEIVQTLAWSLATGSADTASLEMDCGMILYEAVPPDRIIDATEVDDDELWSNYDHRLR